MHSFLISISIGLVEERKASPYLQEPFYPEVVPVWNGWVEPVFIAPSVLKEQTSFTSGSLLTLELASPAWSDTTSSRSAGAGISGQVPASVNLGTAPLGFHKVQDSFLHHIPSTRQTKSQLCCCCLMTWEKHKIAQREKRWELAVLHRMSRLTWKVHAESLSWNTLCSSCWDGKKKVNISSWIRTWKPFMSYSSATTTAVWVPHLPQWFLTFLNGRWGRKDASKPWINYCPKRLKEVRCDSSPPVAPFSKESRQKLGDTFRPAFKVR